MIPPSLLVLSPQGEVWIYPLLRASTEHILIVHTSDIQMILPSLLLLPQGGGLVGFPTAHVERNINDPFKLARCSPQEGHPLLVLLRPSSEALLRARAPGARDQHGCPSPAPHVSIISNRASNSCPQAVQRMQSDSTVNSSARIPMPPQLRHRARRTF